MRIVANGAEREVGGSTTAADLVPGDGQGVAVAVNGEVVPRAQLAHRLLADGDVVEIVTAVQGG